MLEAFGANEIVSKPGKNEQMFRMPDNIYYTWRQKMGNISDPTCVGAFSTGPQNLWILWV